MTAARAPARPAQFAPDPARRRMIAKLHLAKKELGMDDGDYRAVLVRVTGKASAAELSSAQLASACAEMARLGFVATARAPGTKPATRTGDAPVVKKARAMLVSLGHLGVIRNSSEAALHAFALRQLGVERLQWSDQAQVYKLIEALKAIAQRNGWDQSTEGLADPVWTLKYRLCEAIVRRLVAAGLEPPGTGLVALARQTLGGEDGAYQPIMELTGDQLDTIARTLGKRLASARLGADPLLDASTSKPVETEG